MDGAIDRFAVGLTRAIDRRSFLRKAAGNAFKATAVLAVGGTVVDLLAAPVYASCGGAAGPGCPKITNINQQVVSRGCGTSRCCSYIPAGKSSYCNCASGTTCKSVSGYCYGRDTRDYATGCWTCTVVTKRSGSCYYGYVTTCCDCRTSTTRCDSDGTCIGWTSTYKLLGC